MRRHACRGLTLLELLLALAGTAVIGSAVAAMLTGVAYGTATDKDMRSLITRQMALRARLEAEVRESRMLLDAGADYMILWSSDADDDGMPSKAEIQVIEYDAVMDRVMRYAPAPLISDVGYALTDDFRTATNSYKGDSTFPGERWAEQITSFDLTLDDIDPQSAKLVSFRFGMAGGEVPYTGIAAATLRNEVSD
jgi:type II secretory pathway pseudopilin PulG